MTDSERPRAVIGLPTGEVEIDPSKWFAPVTRAELFLTIQQIRTMIFMSTSYTSLSAAGESAKAHEIIKQIRAQDDAMMKSLTDAFALVVSDE